MDKLKSVDHFLCNKSVQQNVCSSKCAAASVQATKSEQEVCKQQKVNSKCANSKCAAASVQATKSEQKVNKEMLHYRVECIPKWKWLKLACADHLVFNTR